MNAKKYVLKSIVTGGAFGVAGFLFHQINSDPYLGILVVNYVFPIALGLVAAFLIKNTNYLEGLLSVVISITIIRILNIIKIYFIGIDENSYIEILYISANIFIYVDTIKILIAFITFVIYKYCQKSKTG